MGVMFKNHKKIKVDFILWNNEHIVASSDFWSNLFGSKDLILLKKELKTGKEKDLLLHLEFQAKINVEITAVTVKLTSDTFSIERFKKHDLIKMAKNDRFSVDYTIEHELK